MPVSKHRHHGKAHTGTPTPPSPGQRRDVATLDELRQAIASPALDFPAKLVLAGVWWFRQLLRKVGEEHRLRARVSRKDADRAAILLCLAMDGERGENDALSPVIAELLRPYCPAPSFAEAWERENRLAPGTAAATAARILGASGAPSG